MEQIRYIVFFNKLIIPKPLIFILLNVGTAIE